MAKTHNLKRDFIKILSSMTDTEINDYIKEHGKPPKLVELVEIIDNKENNKN